MDAMEIVSTVALALVVITPTVVLPIGGHLLRRAIRRDGALRSHAARRRRHSP